LAPAITVTIIISVILVQEIY